MNGAGELQNGEGRTYKGEFLNDLKHGHGCYSWPNGSTYEGSWQNGK